MEIKLATLEAHRGKGIASTMLSYALTPSN